ncbi:type VII secretion protein EssC [Allobacillus sp. GCM10007490]
MSERTLLVKDEKHSHQTKQQNRFIYDIAGENYFSIGREHYDDVMVEGLNATLLFYRDAEHDGFVLEAHEGEVYHNYKRIEGSSQVLHGDQLIVDDVKLVLNKESVELFLSGKGATSKLGLLLEPDHTLNKNFPEYHRSPRIIYREPEEKRTIAKPSPKPSKPSEQLARTVVPPLVMIFALVIISIIQPRGIFIIVMLAMTITTVIFSITSYIKNVRQYNADMRHRDKSYRAYLRNKTKELYQAAEEQRHALTYHYPNVEQIRQMVLEINARIYEKSMYHHDFLHFRTGLGTVDTSFEVEYRDEEFSQDEDELIDQARQLRSKFQKQQEVPVVTTLMNGPVGYVGQRELVIEQIQLFVMQTSMFHSYHDVQFLAIFPESEKTDWDWMRWLPHATLRQLNLRGFVYHERSRDQILHSMYQVLKERRQLLEEKGDQREKALFSPHYVFLITDEKLLLDHVIMEFLSEDPSELGVSLIFVQDVMQSLPEHVTTVIDIRDVNHGTIILEDGELVNKKFTPDHFPEGFMKEDISRGLAPLNHQQNLKNAIPESVTFLEMYQVERVEELAIDVRWTTNETYKTMAVPLGLRGKDDIVQLNLHEKAHGPHGLVAGTTGSGKSEIVQSYILSMAVNFHPHEVAFLLIDYKGGGMANLFRNLPHQLGAITNLDRSQAMRALSSIKAELQKRQRLFGEYDVNHINQYQKLYKQGKVREAMPHLFIISDEFAELKEEQPEFMKELVSTARIGRSLGIHLILATQKPSGVVDDQIWSNSKFKLALKVQNASDSNEVLKTADAAEITLPGRAYLQVGNNEIYELFQSAFSGAEYIPDQSKHEQVDTTIYAINDLGQYEILTQDLSGLDKKDVVESVPTELEAVIDYIHQFTTKEGIERLPRPWLPPLPNRISAIDLNPANFKEAWNAPKKSLQATIGMMDQPELQSQSPLTIDLTKDGHIAVFSSPGYGKSTFMQSLIVDLVKQHHPERLHIYLLDFGTNGLMPLKQLPHVADTFLLDETVKIEKWIRFMTKEIVERKKKLSQFGVADMIMYEKASEEVVPNIVIAIDNYDAVKEADFGEEFDRLITLIAREGARIGVHLSVSAGRQNSMRMPLISNIKQQIALHLIDTIEMRTIIGKTDLEIEEVPGRGIIKQEDPVLFQTSLPAEGEETLEIIEEIRQLSIEMRNFWDGDLPKSIPMMPEGSIDFETFKQNEMTKEFVRKNQLPLGLDFEYVEPVAFNPAAYNLLTVFGDRPDELNKLRIALAKNLTLLEGSYQTMIIDTEEKITADQASNVNVYVYQSQKLQDIKKSILQEIELRGKGDHSGTKWIILINDLQDFSERTYLLEEEVTELFERGPKHEVYFIVVGNHNYLGKSFEYPAKSIRKLSMVGLVAMRLGDQDVFNQPFIRKETHPGTYECYVAIEQQHYKIKVPK